MAVAGDQRVVVEGASDEQVARAVVHAAKREVAKIVVKGGKTQLDPLLPRYNRAALHSPWVVFRDSDTQCPVTLRSRLTAGIDTLSPSFLLRIVHPMSEAWLLADRKGFAGFFQIKESQVPDEPERLQNAKLSVLTLCARSRSRVLSREIVAPGTRTGPLYTALIGEFAAGGGTSRWPRTVVTAFDAPSNGSATCPFRVPPASRAEETLGGQQRMTCEQACPWVH